MKNGILKILKSRAYGIEEEDFLSAELEIVPAGKARDCGFDRSMVAAYGQDDRVCGYTSLEALLEDGASALYLLLPADGQRGDRKRGSHRYAVPFL